MNSGYAIALNEWIFDTSIKNELPLLLYVSILTAGSGYCLTNNVHLARKFGTTTETISRKLKKLEDKGYITIEYKKRGCEVVERKMELLIQWQNNKIKEQT